MPNDQVNLTAIVRFLSFKHYHILILGDVDKKMETNKFQPSVPDVFDSVDSACSKI